jgi:hypothetical protein
MTITTSIDLDAEITFDYQRARRGARDSLGGIRGAGPPLEPDEPESVEITSVTVLGISLPLDDLPQSLMERLEQEALEAATEE